MPELDLALIFCSADFLVRGQLGFDFPGVLPNQKSQSWSVNFDFEDENNPMLGSL